MASPYKAMNDASRVAHEILSGTSTPRPMPSFRDIPQFPRAHYEIDVPWRYIEDTLDQWNLHGKDPQLGALVLDPDYQRAHVWTREQQIAYVEYQLQGGEVGRVIIWNSPDWMGSWKRPTELVDGKQRVEAVRAFVRGDIPAFGRLCNEYTGGMPIGLTFKFRVCKLETREEILQLYLNINAGGTPHTKSEINRVRALLDAERKNGGQS